MNDKYLSPDPYKGVRDFYPEDMAVQRYIFDTWAKTAESFGFARYDASLLEPADLYKAKGAENEEMVNEQTYTFTDRGGREVTLRPEMTPTVARLVAARRRELAFPVRWYSIPNLFRYERPQRGRLREHWQLNCDIFGSDHFSADVELIALAYQTLIDFGAKPEMFEIRLNDRTQMRENYALCGVSDETTQNQITRLNDRFYKLSTDEYKDRLRTIVSVDSVADKIFDLVSGQDQTDTNQVLSGLQELGISNVKIDRSLARGFDYYTGTIFEIFDISSENNRSLLGGGRYDNLTTLFGGEPIAGLGFGMGDVTMRDFLTTHQLLPGHLSVNSPDVMVIPTSADYNLSAQKIAHLIRQAGTRVATDISSKKLGKKIGDASSDKVKYVVVVGEDEIKNNLYTLKILATGEETKGGINDLVTIITKP